MSVHNPPRFGPADRGGGAARGPLVRRSELPAEFTVESIRPLPIWMLRLLGSPGNGVLSAEEQRQFDAALRALMTETRSDLAARVGPAWRRGLEWSGQGGPGSQEIRRLARRVSHEMSVAESLAPELDWAPLGVRGAAVDPSHESGPGEDGQENASAAGVESGSDTRTVDDLATHVSDQVELVALMADIAEVGRRTYDLEAQRDLDNTRGMFFGFLVSVAVIAAGWAPIVTATPNQRLWVGGLTLGTCLVAGLVYALVMRRQRAHRDASQ